MTAAQEPASAASCERRQARLRDRLGRAGLEGILVRDPRNLRYLTGFSGSSGWLLIGPESSWLGVDGRYRRQAAEEAHAVEILGWYPPFVLRLSRLLDRLRLREVGFEGRFLTYDEARALEQAISGVNWHSSSFMVDSLRLRKDPGEVQALEAGAAINDRVFSRLLQEVRAGRRERDIALDIECWSREMGSEAPAFSTIVASGSRSALPHGLAGDRRLQPGDLVVLDYGSRVQGYHSDFTRTLVVGTARPWQLQLHRVVREAQRQALLAVGPGRAPEEVDRAARQVIDSASLGGFFSHGLGHGVGLHIHEGPSVAPGLVEELQEGMVITVEPGVYIPGWAGVRIEDMVLVTGDGCRVLSGSTRELVSVPLAGASHSSHRRNRRNR